MFTQLLHRHILTPPKLFFVTTTPVLEAILAKNNIVARSDWAVFYEGETKHAVFMIPYPDKTTALLYIEETSGYKVPTAENFRSEIDDAHERFEAGAKKFSSILRSGFVEDFNVTAYYLYFPAQL
ncbi:MAG: hypothetical protein ACE5J7_00870 [Candidatus Aenigmatarchaeota archaeon]